MQFHGVHLQPAPLWADLLAAQARTLQRIEGQVGAAITPGPQRALRFLAMGRVRAVILGQDPYPQPGVATGRAFEVAGVQNWADPRLNASLKAILKALYRSRLGLIEPPPIATIRADRRPWILPPDRLFDHWESEGVLLLNTALTCEPGRPGSHTGHWAPFISALITYLRERCPEAVWLLWGSHAAQFRPLLSGARTLCESHPSARDNSFVRATCFTATAELIDWYGVPATKVPPAP